MWGFFVCLVFFLCRQWQWDWEPASRAFPRPMWFTVVRLIYRKVSHHDCFRVQVIGLCTSVMLSGHWPHPPPNLFILPNESSLPMKQRPPTLSSPQQHLISTLFTKDCKKPICFCEWLITIWRPQVCPDCMRILFLLWLYSMDGPLFAYLSMGIWVVPIVFHLETATLFSPVGTPPLFSSITLCRSPVSPILPTFLNFFSLAFCLFSVFHEPLRQCHERLIWGWAVNCHLQSAAWICMEVISRII